MEQVEQGVENQENFANTVPEPDIEFIRLQEVVRLFNVSRATFDRWQRPDSEYYRPDFPKKIRMGNVVMYVRSEVREYMQDLIDKR